MTSIKKTLSVATVLATISGFEYATSAGEYAKLPGKKWLCPHKKWHIFAIFKFLRIIKDR